MTTELVRPAQVLPRTPRLPIVAAIVVAASTFGFGFGVAAMAFVPRAAVPVSLRAIGVPYSMMPATVADAESAGPRASAPTLAACVLPVVDGATTPTACSWDDGFPAIASDGALVVAKVSHDDGGRGDPDVELVFLDARTSKVVRTIVVVSPDEYAEEPAARAKLDALVATRVATAQKLLDAGHYRPLTFLTASGTDASPVAADPSARVELDGDAIRLLDLVGGDVKKETVLWQHRFTPDHTVGDPDRECSGFSLHDEKIYWDRATRTVFASQRYQTGGCMCADEDDQLVARF